MSTRNASPPPKSGLWLALLMAATTASTALASAPVNTNTVFELDNNAIDAASPVGDDWQSIAGTGNVALEADFFTDPVNSGTDDNFTGGGSKDVRDIPLWGSTAATPPDKDDLEHAYAAAYNIDGDLVIYFGADRYSNSGDAAIGFWFFKDDVGDNINGFTGKHTNGDVLVTSDFKQGGSASVINVYEWIGNAPGGPLKLKASSSVGGGTTDPTSKLFCLANGLACAVANPVAIPVPSSFGGYVYKGTAPTNTFPQGTFFEGGVNITALFPNAGTCFASFMAMTRTSASTTAQLKDYVLGAFPLCGISVGKACEGSPAINADGNTVDYVFDVPITNSGSGPVYDVAIEEDSALNSATNPKTTCKITSPISSGNLTTDNAVQVFASIPAGETRNVLLSCNSTSNGLLNSVTARAKSSSGASTRDLEASHSTGEGETCSVQVNPSIQVTKECDTSNANYPTGVRLRAGGGFTVCVKAAVKNTSTEQLIGVDFADNKLGAAFMDNGTLAPNETKSFSGCYDTTAADSGELTPGEAVFSDTVTAVAEGAVSHAPADGNATATCKLCPGADLVCD